MLPYRPFQVSILELGRGTRQIERWQTDRQTDTSNHFIMPPPYGSLGIIIWRGYLASSTLDPTCNGGVEVWLVRETLCLSKSLAKHGLGREALLRHEFERSSKLYIRNIHSDLSQYWQSTCQPAAWLISRDSDYNSPTVQLLEITTELSGSILIPPSVELANFSC